MNSESRSAVRLPIGLQRYIGYLVTFGIPRSSVAMGLADCSCDPTLNVRRQAMRFMEMLLLNDMHMAHGVVACTGGEPGGSWVLTTVPRKQHKQKQKQTPTRRSSSHAACGFTLA